VEDPIKRRRSWSRYYHRDLLRREELRAKARARSKRWADRKREIAASGSSVVVEVRRNGIVIQKAELVDDALSRQLLLIARALNRRVDE
jgi:hypothetical protein